METFLLAIEGHRWAAPLRLAALYGLRRSELPRAASGTASTCDHRIGHDRPKLWSRCTADRSGATGKNARSRRTFGDRCRRPSHTSLTEHRRVPSGVSGCVAGQRVARSRSGSCDDDGQPGLTGELRPDARAARRSAAGLPRLTSHGLRHTAATHMVRQAADVGELRAAADVLGHSPDVLIKTYAHVMPESMGRGGRAHRQPAPDRRPRLDVVRAAIRLAHWAHGTALGHHRRRREVARRREGGRRTLGVPVGQLYDRALREVLARDFAELMKELAATQAGSGETLDDDQGIALAYDELRAA